MFWRRHVATVMAFGIHRSLSSEDVADLNRRAAGEPPRFTGEEYEAVEAARQTAHVQAAPRAMSAGHRKVLELVAYAQLSPSEAALALDISPYAARAAPGPRPQAAPRATSGRRSSGRRGRSRHGGVIP